MKIKYLCPKCRNSLNINSLIVLSGKTRTGLKGIVMLKGDLGDYTSSFSEDFTIVEGNKVTFSCPICHRNLSDIKNKNLAHLIMVNQEGEESHIYFSRIFGEKCTYKISGKEITYEYGDHKNLYRPDWLIDKL